MGKKRLFSIFLLILVLSIVSTCTKKPIPSGKASSMQPNGGSSVSFQKSNSYSPFENVIAIGPNKIQRNLNGEITHVGSEKVQYDSNGIITHEGNEQVH